jgi:hypothetical protein
MASAGSASDLARIHAEEAQTSASQEPPSFHRHLLHLPLRPSLFLPTPMALPRQVKIGMD